KPAVILYRVGWLTYQCVRRLMNARYITLVNLLASKRPLCDGQLASLASDAPDELLYPEYPTWQDCSTEIAGHATEWLKDEGQRQNLISRLMKERERVAGGGASATAADYIVRELSSGKASDSRPLAA